MSSQGVALRAFPWAILFHAFSVKNDLTVGLLQLIMYTHPSKWPTTSKHALEILAALMLRCQS